MVFIKMVFLKFHNFHRKSYVSEKFLFNKVAGDFIKRRLQHSCFLVKFAKNLRIPPVVVPDSFRCPACNILFIEHPWEVANLIYKFLDLNQNIQ